MEKVQNIKISIYTTEMSIFQKNNTKMISAPNVTGSLGGGVGEQSPSPSKDHNYKIDLARNGPTAQKWIL